MAHKGISVTIDTKGANHLANGAAALDAVVSHAIRASGFLVQREVLRRTPVDTGTLRGSIGVRFRGRGATQTAIVGTAVHYAEAVEEGRKPGRMPPVAAIAPWVARNLRASYVQRRTGKTRRRKLRSGLETRSVAYLVARAIGRRGTKGARMFQEGVKAAEPGIIRIVRKAERDLGRALGGHRWHLQRSNRTW